MKKLALLLSLILVSQQSFAQNFTFPKNFNGEYVINTMMECRAFYLLSSQATGQVQGLDNAADAQQKFQNVADNFLSMINIIAQQSQIDTETLKDLQKRKIELIVSKARQDTMPVVMKDYGPSCAKIRQTMVDSLQKFQQ